MRPYTPMVGLFGVVEHQVLLVPEVLLLPAIISTESQDCLGVMNSSLSVFCSDFSTSATSVLKCALTYSGVISSRILNSTIGIVSKLIIER